jgi:hypothetical protein
MLTTEGADPAAIATRLLNQVPQKLDRQTEGYSRMIQYLKHLAQGGEQRAEDNATAAGVYTRRSGAFSKVKNKVSEACKKGDWAKMKKYCHIVIDTHTKIAAFWHISPESFKIQNMKVYKELLEADFGPDIGLLKENKNKELTGRAISDAEKTRVPWQVGKKAIHSTSSMASGLSGVTAMPSLWARSTGWLSVRLARSRNQFHQSGIGIMGKSRY